jgi:hypothetical protein
MAWQKKPPVEWLKIFWQIASKIILFSFDLVRSPKSHFKKDFPVAHKLICGHEIDLPLLLREHFGHGPLGSQKVRQSLLGRVEILPLEPKKKGVVLLSHCLP